MSNFIAELILSPLNIFSYHGIRENAPVKDFIIKNISLNYSDK